MFRSKTKKAYAEALRKMKDTGVKVSKDKFPAESRKWFNNFTALHDLNKMGVLEDVGNGQLRVRPNVYVNKTINKLEKIHHARGEKSKAKNSALKPVTNGTHKVELPSIKIESNGYTHFEPPYEKTSIQTALHLVQQLRDMGYEVTCKKVVEL